MKAPPKNQNARPGGPVTGSSGEHLNTKAPAPTTQAQTTQSSVRLGDLAVTLYQDVLDTKGTNRTLGQCLDYVRSNPKLANRVAELRPLYARAEGLRLAQDDDKDARLAYEDAKKKLPAITFSGTFSKRKIAGLETYSGILQADLDHLGEKGFKLQEPGLTHQTCASE